MTFVVSDLSRAAVTTDLNFAGSRFAVYGDMRFKDHDLQTIFDNTTVTHDGSKWTYADKQYWFPKHEHSFIALNPVDAPGMSDAQYSGSRLSFNYTLPDDYQSASDIIVATHRRMGATDPAATVSPIALNFWHTMARVNFMLKNDDCLILK